MLLRDLACAAFGWALGAALWIGASRVPRSMLSDEFGADGVPRGLAILAIAVSTLIALRALLKRHEPVEAERTAPSTHARAFGIIAIGFAYVFAAPYLGYLATAAMLIAATALYYGARMSASLALVAAGGALFLWWMFAKMLGASMPTGSLWRLLGA